MRFGKSDRPAELEKLIDENTRALFCETVGNPAGNICDLEALAAIAQRARDPADRRQHRADADSHPPVRFRRRHRGALADEVPGRPRHHARRRDRRQRHVPVGGARVRATRCSASRMRPTTASSTPSTTARRPFSGACAASFSAPSARCSRPFNAFLLLQGIETVALRVERHVENARRVAEFLRADARVASVSYAGFPDNPYYPLAQKYLGGRACSLHDLRDPRRLRCGHALLRCAAALQAPGQSRAMPSRSPVIRPPPRTGRCRPEEQRTAGVGPETIRLSVGIEHIDDIIADLDQALAAATRGHEPVGPAGTAAGAVSGRRQPHPGR